MSRRISTQEMADSIIDFVNDTDNELVLDYRDVIERSRFNNENFDAAVSYAMELVDILETETNEPIDAIINTAAELGTLAQISTIWNRDRDRDNYHRDQIEDISAEVHDIADLGGGGRRGSGRYNDYRDRDRGRSGRHGSRSRMGTTRSAMRGSRNNRDDKRSLRNGSSGGRNRSRSSGSDTNLRKSRGTQQTTEGNTDMNLSAHKELIIQAGKLSENTTRTVEAIAERDFKVSGDNIVATGYSVQDAINSARMTAELDNESMVKAYVVDMITTDISTASQLVDSLRKCTTPLHVQQLLNSGNFNPKEELIARAVNRKITEYLLTHLKYRWDDLTIEISSFSEDWGELLESVSDNTDVSITLKMDEITNTITSIAQSLRIFDGKSSDDSDDIVTQTYSETEMVAIVSEVEVLYVPVPMGMIGVTEAGTELLKPSNNGLYTLLHKNLTPVSTELSDVYRRKAVVFEDGHMEVQPLPSSSSNNYVLKIVQV